MEIFSLFLLHNKPCRKTAQLVQLEDTFLIEKRAIWPTFWRGIASLFEFVVGARHVRLLLGPTARH